jgi:hypothetical protein
MIERCRTNKKTEKQEKQIYKQENIEGRKRQNYNNIAYKRQNSREKKQRKPSKEKNKDKEPNRKAIKQEQEKA